MTLQVKEDNKDNNHVANQDCLMEDSASAPKQCPEQESVNMVGKVIQQE